jgi:uncharacterized iron-regulated protein
MTMRVSRAGRRPQSATAAVVLTFALCAALFPPAHAQPSCTSATHTASPIDAWLSATSRHPLVGTILHGTEPLSTAADGCSPSPLAQLQQALTAHLADGGILLLGEIHDNGAQHALRGHLLGAIAADLARLGRPAPALVFEHIRTDQTAALESNSTPAPLPAPASARERARDLLARLDWEKSGWPASDLFLPIFEAAIANKLPILPGHATRAEVRGVALRGLDALPKETVTRLGLDAPLPEPLANALLDELEASHCGLVPRSAFANMALAQRYRDAHLAARLITAASRHGAAILFAGNGHVRTDRGVPWYLARMAPQRKVVAVAFIEVEDAKADPAGYLLHDPSGRAAADYFVFTPRTERADPCDAMRARFKKK